MPGPYLREFSRKVHTLLLAQGVRPRTLRPKLIQVIPRGSQKVSIAVISIFMV